MGIRSLYSARRGSIASRSCILPTDAYHRTYGIKGSPFVAEFLFRMILNLHCYHKELSVMELSPFPLWKIIVDVCEDVCVCPAIKVL